MKLTVQQIKSSVGFTLIELLVVIAIIGILAAALIATIDPLEQIRKAQDTTIRNMAVEYVSANGRYYATHSLFPWGNGVTAAPGGNCAPAPSAAIQTLSALAGGAGTCIGKLQEEKELKDAYDTGTSLTNLAKINVFGSNTEVRACFNPESRSQSLDPATRFASDGVGACVPSTTSLDCFWCTE